LLPSSVMAVNDMRLTLPELHYRERRL